MLHYKYHLCDTPCLQYRTGEDKTAMWAVDALFNYPQFSVVQHDLLFAI